MHLTFVSGRGSPPQPDIGSNHRSPPIIPDPPPVFREPSSATRLPARGRSHPPASHRVTAPVTTPIASSSVSAADFGSAKPWSA